MEVTELVFELYSLEAKIRASLAGYIVPMVANSVHKNDHNLFSNI